MSPLDTLPHFLTHPMSICRPSSRSAAVPPELWLQIFRTATYIPGEWDLAVTFPRLRMRTSWDFAQRSAYKVVLPLRRTIVQVSRVWWEVGTEVLYGTFCDMVYPTTRALDRFERSLSSRPALARFVKRFALSWPHKSDSGQINRVLQLCPNTFILKLYYSVLHYHCIWEPTILTSHIRILDANLRSVSQKEVFQLLSSLPGLEILCLTGLQRGSEDSRYNGTLRLSLVRILSLSCRDKRGLEYWAPLFSTADLPHLTSFSMNLGSALLPLSIDTWRRITFFRCPIEICGALKPEIFRSLTHLHWATCAQTLRGQQIHFPFHQLHRLTISFLVISYTPVSNWKQTAEESFALPLTRSEMPLLRLLELEWGADGIQGAFMSLPEHRQHLSFVDYLESAALEFERLGVQFQEIYQGSIHRIPTPVKDVIKIVRDTMHV